MEKSEDITMKTLTKSILIFIFALTLSFSLCALSFADIPHLINYQGKLTDKAGKPVADGTYSVTFRIYDAESAGTLLWEETQSVSIQKGIFSVLLGGVTALNLAFDVPYWLEIKVGNEVMSPRQRMASVGYAFTAQNANKAQDAATVGTVGISTTPMANKLLPLDSNAKLPSTVLPLKVYDSGWFAVSPGSKTTLNHNLGTTKLLILIYGSTSANGSNAFTTHAFNDGGYGKGIIVDSISSSSFVAHGAANWPIYFLDTNGIEYDVTNGYARVVALALS